MANPLPTLAAAAAEEAMHEDMTLLEPMASEFPFIFMSSIIFLIVV